MQTRQASRRAIRRGARVTDGRGIGTAENNTGLPPICDPREWLWVVWDGDRGMQIARRVELSIAETAETGA